MKRLALTLGLCACFTVLLVVRWSPSNQPLDAARAEQLFAQALAHAERGQLQSAYDELQRILDAFPDHFSAQREKALICIQMRRSSEAAGLIDAMPDDFLAAEFDKCWTLMASLTDSGYLLEAMPLLKRLLQIKPSHSPTRREMLRLYRISGENAAASVYLYAALREPRPELGDLLMCTAPLTNWASPDDVQFMKVVGQRTQDSLTMLGYARRQMQSGQQSGAVEVLRRVVERSPQWQPALAQLAIVYWQLGQENEWREALARFDTSSLNHADSWFIWGVWQIRQGDFSAAVRCFGEALERDPKHAGAASYLIVALGKIGRESEAADWKSYVEHLSQLDQACLTVSQFAPAAEDVRKIVLECRSLGWQREARGWCNYAQNRWPTIRWDEFNDDESPNEPVKDVVELPQRKLLAALDFRREPLPPPLVRQDSHPPSTTPTSVAPPWLLDNEASAMGIRFQFQNGLPSDRKQTYMFEFAGPGVGILDYDGDGWPDLELTQGASWPLRNDDIEIRDELFRNLGDGTFATVGGLAGLDDPGYSQGPAISDFNSDGFPDVYLCNIGPNRCYLNNGDGTFSDITDATGTAGEEWSLSAAWADFNADGHPDLYVVNYLADSALERACVGKDGRRIQCSPTFFAAADDRLYLNLGDGRFQDISEASGIQIPDGKGMGIVVGRLQNSPRPSIFVANDLTPNFLFTSPEVSSGLPHFENVGATAGVAFGPQGTAESSMGVAAGDVNGDGHLDLFVTNFLAEATNLLIQQPDGVFEDVANRYGLLAGGLTTEGWGTQFLDIDADGWLDLFVANGHLEEYSAADRMPAQLFRNQQGGRLDLVSGPAIGQYFRRNYLGRSVALWDWNRDGREDLAVSHVTDPVAVLTNRTQEAGHRIGLRLIGVQAARDPIGAKVTVISRERTLVRELIGGNGYAASNERRLYFGLGLATGPVELEVEWPSGAVQNLTAPVVDQEYLLIEGHSDAIPLVNYRLSP